MKNVGFAKNKPSKGINSGIWNILEYMVNDY